MKSAIKTIDVCKNMQISEYARLLLRTLRTPDIDVEGQILWPASGLGNHRRDELFRLNQSLARQTLNDRSAGIQVP